MDSDDLVTVYGVVTEMSLVKPSRNSRESCDGQWRSGRNNKNRINIKKAKLHSLRQFSTMQSCLVGRKRWRIGFGWKLWTQKCCGEGIQRSKVPINMWGLWYMRNQWHRWCHEWWRTGWRKKHHWRRNYSSPGHRYPACLSCRIKVTLIEADMGECTKCSTQMKVSRCITCKVSGCGS